MKKSDIDAYIIDYIMSNLKASKLKAKKLYYNALTFNVVKDAILEQVNFLIENNIDLL